MNTLVLLDPCALRTVTADVRVALAAVYGDRLIALILFGSYARGDAQAGSDVDVLAVLRGEVDPAREIARNSASLAELSLRHDVLISCAFVSEARWARERSPFLTVVRREGVAA